MQEADRLLSLSFFVPSVQKLDKQTTDDNTNTK